MRIGSKDGSPGSVCRSMVLALLLAWLPIAQAAGLRAFSPQGEVAVVRQVRAVFTDPMVRLGEPRHPAPFDLVCSGTPPGAGRWTDERTWVHEFEQPLAAGARCVARPRAGLRTLDGVAPSVPAEVVFTTGGPAVVRTLPPAGAHVDEEQVFVLVLSGAVDPVQLRQRAWCEVSGLGERVPVRVVEGDDRDRLVARYAARDRFVLVLGCARRLPGDAALDLVWDAGIVSREGVPTRRRQVLRYKVRAPFAAAFGCTRENAAAPCTPLGEMRVEFNAPVDRALAQAVRLAFPAGPRMPVPESDSSVVSSVVFRGPFPESTPFRILLPDGLRDADGRPLSNAAAFPMDSRTAAYPPLAKFAAAPFGILESHAEPAMPVTLRGIEPSAGLSVVAPGRDQAVPPGPDRAAPPQPDQLRTLRAQDDAEVMAWFARVSLLNQRMVGEDALRAALGQRPSRRASGRPEPEVDTRAISLLSTRVGARALPLPSPAPAGAAWPFEVIGVPLPDPGFHVLEIQSRSLGASLLEPPAPMYVRTAALVTNLAVHFKNGRENALVWVTTLDRGAPVPDAQIRISDCAGRALWQGRTDREGIARVATALAEQPASCDEHRPGYFVSARARDRLGRDDFSFVWSDWNQGIESWRFNVPTGFERARTVRAHTVFDRTLVRAGETVSMKHLVRLAGLDGFGRPADRDLPASMTVVHVGSEQSYAVPLRWRGAASDVVFRLPPAARSGRYEVFLDYGPDGTRPQAAGPGASASEASASDAPGRRLWDGRLLSGAFRVEAFRLPVFDAAIGLASAPVVAAAAVPADVRVSYLSGGPAARLPVSLSALLRVWAPRFDGFDAFSFAREDLMPEDGEATDAEPPRGSDDRARSPVAGVHRERLVTDRRTAVLDAAGAARVEVGPLPPVAVPHRLSTELTYADPSGELQSVSRSVVVWPSAHVVGIATGRWVSPGREIAVRAAVLDTAGRPVERARVRVRATLLRTITHRKRLIGGFYAYESVTESRALGEVCLGRTDAGGVLACDARMALRPGEAGRVLLVAESADPAGRTASASTSVWVSEGGETWFEAENQDRIDLVPERRAYAPGETARLQVRMPFREATALVALEREGVLDTRVVRLSGRDPVLSVPITAAHTPNVYVSVLAVRGRLREVPWYSMFVWGWRAPLDWWREWRAAGEAAGRPLAPTATVDLARPAFRLGIADLTVSPESSRLRVAVATDRKDYPVRSTVDVAIEVRDATGRPVPAGTEVAVAAVDQALLELQPNHSWNLFEAMMQRRAYGVETATAQMQVVGKRHFGRKAMAPGGDGGRAPTRELFDTLVYWNPRVVLDAQGRARVPVALNDALTAFRIVAVADAGAGMFGTGEATIRSSQDLQLIGGLSPMAREGDAFAAGFTVRNTTTRAMRVQVEAVAKAAQGGAPDPAHGEGGSAATAARTGPVEIGTHRGTLELAAGASARIDVPVEVPAGATRIDWTLSARQEGGAAADRLVLRQSVAPAVPQTVRQATLARVDGTFALPLGHEAGALAGRSAVRIALSASIAGSLDGVRDWLTRYPYTCLEQRASRAAGLADRTAWDALMVELPAYLDADGLATYFAAAEGAPPSGSDTLTAHLLSLSDAAALPLPREARERMLAGLTAFVEGRIRREVWSPQPDLPLRRLAALAALARHGRASVAMLSSFDIAVQRLPDVVLLDWIAVLQRLPALPRQAAQLEQAWQVLRARLVASGTRLALGSEGDTALWWLMASHDAVAARLLLQVVEQPEWRDDAPRLLAALLGRMRRGAWDTTTANAWGAIAVRRFAAVHEHAPVGGRTRVEIAPAGPAPISHDWAAPRADVEIAQPDAPATLTVQHRGAGRPWVAVQSLATVPLEAPVSSGYRLARRLEPVERRDATRWSRGDIVRVRLEFDARQPMNWVVLDDPVPAGATVLGSGLGRDSAIAVREPSGAARELQAQPTFVERGHAATRAYFEHLPAGRHVWHYTLRLNQSGVFRLPPSRIEAMYAPDVHGALPNPDLSVAP